MPHTVPTPAVRDEGKAPRCTGRLFRQWQCHAHAGAARGFGDDRVASMQSRNAAHQREAEAAATGIAAHLVEGLEDVFALLARNAGAGVAHLQDGAARLNVGGADIDIILDRPELPESVGASSRELPSTLPLTTNE